MRRTAPTALALALALAGAACSRGPDEEGRRRLFARDEGERPKAEGLDPARPGDALSLDAEEVARRLGSFDWTAAVEWTVEARGDEARRVRAVERHRVRQSATGEFEVHADLDPGLGAGSETGRDVVHAGGMTYARARYAPYRERPTDRGRDARRFREESFQLPRAVARLYGDALTVTPAGEATVLGRPARRFKLSLAKEAQAATSAPPAAGTSTDDDTKRRLAFLAGRVPVTADGELVLDAETGAPLRVRLGGAFAVREQPAVRTTVELLAEVKALGGGAGAVAAPKDALPDERKAAGVAGALEAAGLRKRGEEKPAPAEPADEPVE